MGCLFCVGAYYPDFTVLLLSPPEMAEVDSGLHERPVMTNGGVPEDLKHNDEVSEEEGGKKEGEEEEVEGGKKEGEEEEVEEGEEEGEEGGDEEGEEEGEERRGGRRRRRGSEDSEAEGLEVQGAV